MSHLLRSKTESDQRRLIQSGENGAWGGNRIQSCFPMTHNFGRRMCLNIFNLFFSHVINNSVLQILQSQYIRKNVM